MSKTNSVRRKHAAKLARGGFRSGWSRRRLMPRTKFFGHDPSRSRWGWVLNPLVTPKLVAAVFDPRRAGPREVPPPAYPSRASRRLMRAGGMKNTATARKCLAEFAAQWRRVCGVRLSDRGVVLVGIVRMPEGWYVR